MKLQCIFCQLLLSINGFTGPQKKTIFFSGFILCLSFGQSIYSLRKLGEISRKVGILFFISDQSNKEVEYVILRIVWVIKEEIVYIREYKFKLFLFRLIDFNLIWLLDLNGFLVKKKKMNTSFLPIKNHVKKIESRKIIR